MEDTRTCLKCREKFKPDHRYNFLCWGCKSSNEKIKESARLTTSNTGRLIKKDIGES